MADINKQYTIRKAYYSTYEQGTEKYGTENTQESSAQQTLELPGNIEQSQAADQNVSTQPTKIETNTGGVANPSPEAHRRPVLISDNNISQGTQQVNSGVDSTATAEDNITTNQAQQIQGGTDNVRDYVYNRNRGRDVTTYTSQQTGRMGEGTVRTQRAASDAGRTAIKRTAAARDLRLERVSGRDYGISQATENKTFSVLPESAYDDELNTVSKEIYDKTGKQAIFTIGSIEIQTQNGVKAVRGVSTNEYILVQANNPRATATQIGQHEIYHELARQNPGLNEKVMQAITQEHSQQEVDAQIGRYIENYRSVYDADNPEEGLVFADAEAMRQQEVYDMLKEEFLADAYAGLNSYGAQTSRYTDQAQQATKEYVPANSPSNQSQGVQQTRGPDKTYSIDGSYAQEQQLEKFKKEFRTWYTNTEPADRMTDGGYFTVGTTSDALRTIGIKAGKIYCRKFKLGYIMQQHPEMTPEIIEQVPEIIENPIIVLKSLTQPDSVVVFRNFKLMTSQLL